MGQGQAQLRWRSEKLALKIKENVKTFNGERGISAMKVYSVVKQFSNMDIHRDTRSDLSPLPHALFYLEEL